MHYRRVIRNWHSIVSYDDNKGDRRMAFIEKGNKSLFTHIQDPIPELIQSCNFGASAFIDVKFASKNIIETPEDERSYDALLYNNNFKFGYFVSTKFSNIRLCENGFYGSHMENVIFDRCECKINDFSNSTLKNIIFKHCLIPSTKFIRCNMQNVIFEDCRIENCKFLETTFKDTFFNDKTKLINPILTGIECINSWIDPKNVISKKRSIPHRLY